MACPETRRTVLISLLVGLAAGCEDEGLIGVRARLEVPERLDFGRASLGVAVERSVPLVVEGGAPVRIGSVVIRPATAPVEVEAAPSRIASGSQGALRLQYRPLEALPLQASLHIETDELDEDGKPILHTVALTGQGVRDGLGIVPRPVNFGAVRVGDKRQLRARITNQLSGPIEVSVEVDDAGSPRIEGGDGGFGLGPVGPNGRLAHGALAPGGSMELELLFAPLSEGEDRGRIELRFCEHPLCRESLGLIGQGVDRGLWCRPATIDFGYVAPGQTEMQALRCENRTHRAMTLSPPIVSGDRAERFSAFATATYLGPFEVADVELSVTPTAEERGQTLQAELTLEARPAIGSVEIVRVPLRAQVARAELRAHPSPLQLGPVAVGVEVQRAVILTNTGDRPVNVRGVSIAAPFSSQLVGATLQPGSSRIIDVRVLPEAEGVLSAMLSIDVDDEAVEDLLVPVSATALALPPCRVTIQPRQIDFGLARVLSEAQRGTVVTNDAAYPCLLRDPTVEGEAFLAVPLEGGSVVLDPGERARLEVRFRPEMAGEHRGTLRFGVSDPAAPYREVDLLGVAGESNLRVDPARLDFGTVRPGCVSDLKELRIFNLGPITAHIDELRTSSAEFALVDPPSGSPAPPGSGLSLASGDFMTLRVRYLASQLGIASPAAVRVRDRAATAWLVDLVGATSDGRVSERFVQRPSPAVDVLFVIDNSLSMQQEQANVIANAGRFLSILTQEQSDYQVAVISTDMSEAECNPPSGTRPPGARKGACGWFSDGDASQVSAAWRIIDAGDQPDPELAFSRVANLGLDGSAQEAGLAAAERALSPALLSGHNRGFIRPDASLALIFVSDEEDQSPQSVGTYIAAFRSLKGSARSDQMSVSAVLATGVCGFEAGRRYREVVGALGGIVRSICTSDWAGVTVDLARRALGIRDTFPLNQVPEEQTLTVTVDGLPLPQRDNGRRNWRYRQQPPSIAFERAAVPRSGSEIHVSYRPACITP